MLEPLSTSQQRGAFVYGVIEGTSVSNVGKSTSITAPKSTSQANTILAALANANLRPDDIQFLESHGTGTLLGDQIEIEGLRQAFSSRTEELMIGSVKTNFGHLDSAAGLLGVAKVVAMMMFRKIFPTMNIRSPHAGLKEGKVKLDLVESVRPWKSDRLLAGISSYGLNGTTSHVVIGSCNKSLQVQTDASRAEAEKIPLVIFALDTATLYNNIQQLTHLLELSLFKFSDVCFSSLERGSHTQHTIRLVIFANSAPAAIQTMKNFMQKRDVTSYDSNCCLLKKEDNWKSSSNFTEKMHAIMWELS